MQVCMVIDRPSASACSLKEKAHVKITSRALRNKEKKNFFKMKRKFVETKRLSVNVQVDGVMLKVLFGDKKNDVLDRIGRPNYRLYDPYGEEVTDEMTVRHTEGYYTARGT